MDTQQWSPEERNDFAPPWSPVQKLVLTPKTPSTPAPGILKKSSDITMVTVATQLDEESQKHEQAEEEEPTRDPCVCPRHDDDDDDVVIEVESGDECLMSPGKMTTNEDKNAHNAAVRQDGPAVEGFGAKAPAAAAPHPKVEAKAQAAVAAAATNPKKEMVPDDTTSHTRLGCDGRVAK